MFWLQVFVVAFFLGFGLLMLLGVGSSAAAICVLIALFFFALGSFFLLNLIGFRSQHVTVRDGGISFALPALGRNTVLPWTLQRHQLPWNSVRAVDVKLRNLGGEQRVYVLRTTAGDFVFFWPQWPNADEICQEIIRRSGAGTSTEDMAAPPVADPLRPDAPIPASRGERFMRGCGLALLILITILVVLCGIALIGAKPDDRINIAKAMLFLGLGAAGADQMRRYRRIR